MRRFLLTVVAVVCTFALWPASGALATHNPCDPAGPICIRINCPAPPGGVGWIWLDHHGFPAADFTHCPLF